MNYIETPDGGVWVRRPAHTWAEERSGPHGGWLEAFAKAAFLAIVTLLIVQPIALWVMAQPPRMERQFTGAEVEAILAKAYATRDAFFAKQGNWTPEEAVSTRNQLFMLRDRLSPGEARSKVQAHIAAVVSVAFDTSHARVEQARESGAVTEFQKAAADDWNLSQAFQAPLPGTPPAEITDQRIFLALGSFLWFLAKLYLLFIPFAFLIFLARARKLGYSLADEFVFGWRNLAVSSFVWPFGISEYPRNTALAFRRHMVEAEFRMRIGKAWRWPRGEELTLAEQRTLEALVLAPKVELAAKLDAIRKMPAEALWQARATVYASMVAGYFLAPFSMARAQDASSEKAEPPAATAVAVDEKPSFEVNGFLVLEGSVPSGAIVLPHAHVFGRFKHGGTSALVHLNLAKPALLEAQGSVALPGNLRVTAGQFFQRSGYAVPAPPAERLIGGPEAAALIHFFDIGVEVGGTHSSFDWSAAIVSGAGANTPDNNVAKDVIAGAALGPFGPLKFQLAFQAGEQPEGWRIRSAAHVALDLKPVTLEALTTHEWFKEHSLAASVLLGWRVHEHVDVAIGWDGLWLAGVPPNQVGRAQVTFLGFGERFRVGAMARFDSATSAFQGIGRLQLGF